MLSIINGKWQNYFWQAIKKLDDNLEKFSYNTFGVNNLKSILEDNINSRSLNITGICSLIIIIFVNSWEDFIWYGKGRNNE